MDNEIKSRESASKVLSSHPKVWATVEVFGSQLARGEYGDLGAVAKTTALVLKVVAVATCNSGEATVSKALRAVGRYLVGLSKESRFVVGNITRRVLKLVKEIFDEPEEDLTTQESMKEGLSLFVDDVENTLETMIDNAAVAEQIHSDEVVLTFGWSVTVEKLLLEAAKKRRFQVVIAEGAPDGRGREFAKVLASEAKLDVFLIPDASIFAIMQRVHKVFIGADAIMADGTLVAAAGTLLVATVAKHYAKSVIACAELYKLTPFFPQSTLSNSAVLHPAAILRHELACEMPNVNVVNPAADYIPPELIALLLTDLGSTNPAVVYRHVQRFYDEVDTPL